MPRSDSAIPRHVQTYSSYDEHVKNRRLTDKHPLVVCFCLLDHHLTCECAYLAFFLASVKPELFIFLNWYIRMLCTCVCYISKFCDKLAELYQHLQGKCVQLLNQ